MVSKSISLPAEAIPDLRRMLAIGLAALGEVERVQEHIGLERACGRDVPGALHPKHPTGAHEMANFAGALMWLDLAAPVEA